MKKSALRIGVSFLFVLVFCSASYASLTQEISISGLANPSGIEAANVWFNVSDFSVVGGIVTLGDAIPPALSFGWQIDTKSVASGLFKLALSNMDGWFSGNSNNLLNGTIATFSYDGTISGVNFYQFGDSKGTEVAISLVSSNANATQFSAPTVVPIPAAVWLLGSGLVGLVALRRRLKK